MARYYTGRRSWICPNFYLVEKNLVEGAQTEYDAVFLVDVGGGKGRGLQELYRKRPRLPGKLVLEDVKGVIEEAEAFGLDEKTVLMNHDFAKQPIIVHEPITCNLVCTTGPIPKPTTFQALP